MDFSLGFKAFVPNTESESSRETSKYTNYTIAQTWKVQNSHKLPFQVILASIPISKNNPKLIFSFLCLCGIYLHHVECFLDTDVYIIIQSTFTG